MTTRFVQLAYVARSVPEKCEQLFKAFDIGPFVYASNLELGNHRLWGKPADLNIEVIEIKSKGPNAMTVMFQGAQEGIQHIACFCDDVFAERDRLADLGYPTVSEFQLGDITICFADTRAILGHMVELYQDHPILRDLYARTRRLREEWDGKTLFYDF